MWTGIHPSRRDELTPSPEVQALHSDFVLKTQSVDLRKCHFTVGKPDPVTKVNTDSDGKLP